MFDWFLNLSFGWQLYLLLVSFWAISLTVAYLNDYRKAHKKQATTAQTIGPITNRVYDWAVDGL